MPRRPGQTIPGTHRPARLDHPAALPALTALTAFSRLAFGMLSAERLLLNPLARAGNCFTGRRADNFHPGLTRSGEPNKGPADGAAQKRLANRIIFNGFVNFGQPPAFSRRSLPR